jgi:hypothetical protein
MLLGAGVMACLIILTVISAFDLRMDYKKHSSSINKKPMPYPGMVYGSTDISICPSCQITIVPYCSYCGSRVQWNPMSENYYCTVCKKNIRVICPDCGIPMKPFCQPLPPVGTQLAALYGPADALCICPSCKTKIVPTCFYCGDHVRWDAATGNYFCPICKKHIDVMCTSCAVPMKPFYPSNGSQVALPSPGGGNIGNPGYLTCPNCAYTMLNQPGISVNDIICPGCGSKMNGVR